MLQAGFGSADVTPAEGMQMPGGFARRTGKAARDKLWAVAGVVYDGTNAVALVGTDTLEVPRSVVDAARRAIQKATKIPGDNVLVGASHTHTGGYETRTCLASKFGPDAGQRLLEAGLAALNKVAPKR